MTLILLSVLGLVITILVIMQLLALGIWGLVIGTFIFALAIGIAVYEMRNAEWWDEENDAI